MKIAIRLPAAGCLLEYLSLPALPNLFGRAGGGGARPVLHRGGPPAAVPHGPAFGQFLVFLSSCSVSSKTMICIVLTPSVPVDHPTNFQGKYVRTLVLEYPGKGPLQE